MALFDFALGEIGLLPDDFWSMTWPEYESHVRGYHIRQNRDWERTRLICTQMYNMLAEKPLKPAEYMSLSTDPQVINKGDNKAKETPQEFLERMQKNNFYRPVKPELSDK